MKFFLIICCCFITSNLFAQNLKAIEADLLRSFKTIDYWRDKSYTEADGPLGDSLERSNDIFGEKLQGYVIKYPKTISYPFNSLVKNHLDISTSADGLFRIYSWDTWTGGTMHFFESVMQYKSGSNFKAIIDTTKFEGDVRPNYHDLFTFKANGKAYYLAVYLSIASTIEVADGIHIFTIDNGNLTDAKIIKTHSGLHSELENDYDFRSVVNIEYGKRPKPRFDEKTNTIYLPLVDGNYKMTNKFILYKFTGQYFEKVKN
ncbi:MAG: hypothetical protein ACXVB0_15600 [Mucilaginibacter sp.]